MRKWQIKVIYNFSYLIDFLSYLVPAKWQISQFPRFIRELPHFIIVGETWLLINYQDAIFKADIFEFHHFLNYHNLTCQTALIR